MFKSVGSKTTMNRINFIVWACKKYLLLLSTKYLPNLPKVDQFVITSPKCFWIRIPLHSKVVLVLYQKHLDTFQNIFFWDLQKKNSHTVDIHTTWGWIHLFNIYHRVLYCMSCKPILNMGKVVKCNNLGHFSLELCVSGVIFHRYFT